MFMTQRAPKGKIGLWTKADSVTAFDDLMVSQPDRREGLAQSI